MENAVSSLEAYFGRERGGISRILLSGLISGLRWGGVSLGFWGLAIGIVLPLWFLAKTKEIADKQFKM